MSDATEKAANDSVKQRIASALISSGYTTLDAQADALGLGRSTTWYIVKSKHKIGRLSAKVRRQMLANPNLPPLVRRELDAHDSAEALSDRCISRKPKKEAEAFQVTRAQVLSGVYD